MWMRTSRRTTGIWMGPEWYVGQDVQEVNEMWERDKVAGWWTRRRAAGGGDRTEVGDYTGEGGGMGEDGDRTDGEVGLEAGRDAVRSATGGRGDGASNGDAQGVARSTQGADRGRQTRTVHNRPQGYSEV